MASTLNGQLTSCCLTSVLKLPDGHPQAAAASSDSDEGQASGRRIPPVVQQRAVLSQAQCNKSARAPS